MRTCSTTKLALFAASCLALLAATTGVAAAGPESGKAGAAPGDKAAGASPADNKIQEARDHYDRGLKLYDSGDYDAARVEFERAYQIAPSYRILYNIGLVQRQKQDYVGALRNFELYLSEGGASLPDVRRKQVEGEIAEIRSLIASATVETNVPEAEIFVDDVPVGKTPLREPVLLNPGRRRITATKRGRLPAAKVVEVAGRDKLTVKLDLAEGKQLIVLNKPVRRVPWIGWGVTAVLAGGAAFTGVTALGANSDNKEQRDLAGVSADDLDASSSKARTFGLVTDGLVVGAVVAAGISTYYTIKWGQEYSIEDERYERKQREQQRQALVPKVYVTPVGAFGTF